MMSENTPPWQPEPDMRQATERRQPRRARNSGFQSDAWKNLLLHSSLASRRRQLPPQRQVPTAVAKHTGPAEQARRSRLRQREPSGLRWEAVSVISRSEELF